MSGPDLGIPINVIGARNKAFARGELGEPEPFHIGGSDASGIVYKVGKAVTTLKVGDEVIIHCGRYSRDCEWVKRGGDPMYSPTYRIWGYETNWGSFAQFTKVQAQQCMPKPRHMNWEEASAYTLVAATAWRMLHGWGVNAVKKDDVVLIWGGAGGLGSMAIQIAKAAGATPIAIVSGPDKFDYCLKLGAKGCINRNDFDHWGMLPHWKDNAGYAQWLKGVRAFGAKIWEVLGEKRAPNIIFEHPGETTIPTSIFVCDTGGMVVVCAGTTGYNATVDLRYLWMRQKRLQGSHFANTEQSNQMNELALRGLLDPCLSRAFPYTDIPHVHQLMYENKHPHGNMAVLVGAREFGLGAQRQAAGGDRPSDPAQGRRAYHAGAVSHVRAVARHRRGRGHHHRRRRHPGPGVDASRHHRLRAGRYRRSGGKDHGGSRNPCGGGHGRRPGDRRGVADRPGAGAAGPDLGAGAGDAGAKEIMTPGCATCDAGMLLSEAVSLMTGRRMHRLVVTENGQPTGVISMTDVVRKLIGE